MNAIVTSDSHLTFAPPPPLEVDGLELDEPPGKNDVGFGIVSPPPPELELGAALVELD